jgi:signal transduction histidine kinase
MEILKRQSVPELRWNAEEIFRESRAQHPPRSEAETHRLLHEFEVQKIELELQNQELRASIEGMEQAMRDRDELEIQVAERTARLETALREQEAFSYSVSHDLRAPLRHINSFLTILTEDFGELLPSEAHSYLDRSRTASRQMGKIIDDLLELSRISRVKLAEAAVDLGELAQKVCTALHDGEPQRQVDFVISDDLYANGDKSLLTQMLVNLLGNAWKYTAANPSARVEFGKEVNAGQEIFYIRDNGVGFDMAFSDKLFGAFQRLHGAEFEGTGIGLATVKRIIERHSGRIWAESKPDQGATFYFTL